MKRDNWQKAVQGSITAAAGSSAHSLCSLKLSSHLHKLPPNPPLSNLAVILSFHPTLSSPLSLRFLLSHYHLSLCPFLFFWPGKSAEQIDRAEHEGKLTNMVKIKRKILKRRVTPSLFSPLVFSLLKPSEVRVKTARIKALPNLTEVFVYPFNLMFHFQPSFLICTFKIVCFLELFGTKLEDWEMCKFHEKEGRRNLPVTAYRADGYPHQLKENKERIKTAKSSPGV